MFVFYTTQAMTQTIMPDNSLKTSSDTSTVRSPLLPTDTVAENSYQWFERESYQCYLYGYWDKLIELGNRATRLHIDYKYLRQRMGYAYFCKREYFDSEKQYKKAYEFDESDQLTILYLYYCTLNLGENDAALYYAQKMDPKTKKELKINGFKPFDAIDLEYNYKYNNSTSRSNPLYYRVGLQSQLSHRFSLYMAGSDYLQTISGNSIQQPEFYSLLNWSASSTASIGMAYHFINTLTAGTTILSHFGLIDFTKRINRFRINGTLSFLKSPTIKEKQISLSGGYILGRTGFLSIQSTLIGMFDKSNRRLNFAQSATVHLLPKGWLEGRAVFGNLNNYSDNRGLYIYNPVDPTTFRAGATFFYLLNRHLSVTLDYTIDTKKIESLNYEYYQQSFSGGLRWKF